MSRGPGTRPDLSARNWKHGMAKTPEHVVWIAMIQRCKNPNNKYYRIYGGRGVRVCDAWLSFAAFIRDMGPRPSPRHSIDRLDRDGNYEPDNCRWATATEQARNTSRNRFISHDGQTMTLVEWAEKTGIAQELIRARIDRLGWNVKKALTAAVRRRRT